VLAVTRRSRCPTCSPIRAHGTLARRRRDDAEQVLQQRWIRSSSGVQPCSRRRRGIEVEQLTLDRREPGACYFKDQRRAANVPEPERVGDEPVVGSFRDSRDVGEAVDAADAAGGADQLPERSLLLFADLVEVGELVTEDRVRDAINRRDRDTRSVAERAAASAREVDIAFCRKEHAADDRGAVPCQCNDDAELVQSTVVPGSMPHSSGRIPSSGTRRSSRPSMTRSDATSAAVTRLGPVSARAEIAPAKVGENRSGRAQQVIGQKKLALEHLPTLARDPASGVAESARFAEPLRRRMWSASRVSARVARIGW